MSKTQSKEAAPIVTTTNVWGTFTTQGEGKLFTPDLKLPRISNPLFSAWIKLCYHFADYQAKHTNHKASLEVQTVILCNKTDWIFCIPKQNVTGGSVKDAQLNDCVNILTGERYVDHKYPRGYRAYGTSHSH